MKKFTIKNGALGVGDSIEDFEIGGEISLPLYSNVDNIRYETNQGLSLDCTLHAPVGVIADLFNYQYTATEIQEVVARSYVMGRPPKGGRQTMLGVKCATKMWNEKNPDKKVIYFAIDVLSNNFKDALKKGHSVVVTYRGNSLYNQDFMQDGILDGIEYKPMTYGHAVASTAMLELGDNGKIYIKDNYFGRKFNYYELKDIHGLISSETFFSRGYIILPEASSKVSLAELKNLSAQKILIQRLIADLGTLWHSYGPIESTVKDNLHTQANYYRGLLVDINLKMSIS